MSKDYGPQITALRLFKNTSAKGTTYFTGRWGLLKVALLKSNDVSEDGSEIWNLVFSEAPPRSADKSAPNAARRDWQRPTATPTDT